MAAATLPEPDHRERWLNFVSPHPCEGERRLYDGDWWEFRRGFWGVLGWRDPGAFSKEADLFHQLAVMHRHRATPAEIASVIPERYAVEVVDPHGDKRIDYKGIPIRNADGSLNRYGRALIELHETPNLRETALSAEIQALVPREQMIDGYGKVVEVPARIARKVAASRGLKPLRRRRGEKGRVYGKADGSRVQLQQVSGAIEERPA